METILPPPELESPAWPVWQKISFRFFFLFFSLLILAVFYVPWLGDLMSEALYSLAIYIKRHLLHLGGPDTHLPTGSGDTLDDWILHGLFLFVALTGTLVWSILDRRRPHYQRLSAWLDIALRYYIALNMFGYGFAKVFEGQFVFPGPPLLEAKVGDLTPMRLCWIFMGYSKMYTAFTGLAEVLGGVLLLFRRTTTLGALVSVGVMANVAMLNFAYDIPVKLFSSTLLLMACYLLARDGRRFVQFFFQNQAVSPANLSFSLPKRWMRIGRVVFKTLFIIGFVGVPVWQGFFGAGFMKRYGFYGNYQVERFVLGSDTLSLSMSDTLRWTNLAFSEGWSQKMIPGRVSIGQSKNIPFMAEMDAAQNTLTLNGRLDTSFTARFNYQKLDSTHVLLRGDIGKDFAQLWLRKVEKEYPLVKHSFHWIAEKPW